MTTRGSTEGATPTGRDRAAVRAAQKQKFDWCRAVSADDELSSAAKHLACITAIDKFGSNGSFKATQNELAKICGASGRTVRRAIKELTGENYWAAENLPGANRYTIIPQKEREQMWADAESEWQTQGRKWDTAKREWERRVERWLDAENKAIWYERELPIKMAYTLPIFSMLYKHMGYEAAREKAEDAWVKLYVERGIPLDDTLQQLAEHYSAAPGPQPEERPTAATEVATQGADMATHAADMATQGADMTTQAADMATQVATPEALTSGNNDSHRSFQVRQDRQGLDKNFQDAPATPRAMRARATRAAQTATAAAGAAVGRPKDGQPCQLCDPVDGIARSRDDEQEIHMLRHNEDKDEIEEMPLRCRHSVEENVKAIHQIVTESDGDWGRTGPDTRKSTPVTTLSTLISSGQFTRNNPSTPDGRSVLWINWTAFYAIPAARGNSAR